MESMEFLTSPDSDAMSITGSSAFQTVRVETDVLPPIVELGRKLLLKAQEGDAIAVKELMQEGAPFTTDWLGTSAIHWACQLNHEDVVRVLLKAGISRDARNKVDRTPLHVTAQEGHVTILKLLLEHGVDVDATDMLRMTPLHWAAEYGHTECVRLLLEHGADPLAVNKFDKTPDQISFDNNRLDITHIIQEYAENPLLEVRRRAAKEMQKQAAAAHKAALEIEKQTRTPIEKLTRPPVKIGVTIDKSSRQGDLKEVRILNVPKRKVPPKVMFENNLNSTNHLMSNHVNEPAQTPDTEKTLSFLQAHGITMLPPDESTIVESAVQGGQKIMLTEAGKMALNLTEKQQVRQIQQQPQVMKPIRGVIKLPELLKGKKVITITADKLINMKNEKKVIIQTDRRFKSTFMPTPSAPPPLTKPKEVLVKKTFVNNKPHLISSYVNDDSTNCERLVADGESEDETELHRVKRELNEARQELEVLREQLLKKDEELLEYKRVLDLLQSDK